MRYSADARSLQDSAERLNAIASSITTQRTNISAALRKVKSMDGFSAAYEQLRKCESAVEAQEKTAKSMAQALRSIANIYSRTESDVIGLGPDGFRSRSGAAGAAGTIIFSGGMAGAGPHSDGGPRYDGPGAYNDGGPGRFPGQVPDGGHGRHGGEPHGNDPFDRDALWHNEALNRATEPCRPPNVIFIGTIELRTLPVIEMMVGTLCSLESAGVRIRLR